MQLFVLTGAPGSGKTAVLDHLGPDIDRIPEPAREILSEQRSVGGLITPQSDPSLFVDLLLERSIRGYEAARRSEQLTMFDRGVPDCVAYAVVLGVDQGPSIRAADRYRYHADVLVLEPWEAIYTTDDERTMSFGETLAFHEALVQAYQRARYGLIPVPRGSVEERAGFIRSFVDHHARRL